MWNDRQCELQIFGNNKQWCMTDKGFDIQWAMTINGKVLRTIVNSE